MTNQAIDPDAVERLRRRLGRSGEPETGPGSAESADSAAGADAAAGAGAGGAAGGSAGGARVRTIVRRVGAPVLGRARRELDVAVERDRASLQRQIDELRIEVERLRAEHAAGLAALREQVARPVPPAA